MDETKFGKCPWCGQENQRLYFAIGALGEGKIWAGHICLKCLNEARNKEWEHEDQNA